MVRGPCETVATPAPEQGACSRTPDATTTHRQGIRQTVWYPILVGFSSLHVTVRSPRCNATATAEPAPQRAGSGAQPNAHSCRDPLYQLIVLAVGFGSRVPW